jgi:hypothetical protein
MDPIKYLFEKPGLSGRTARWQLLLAEFDITYVTQKSIKGRALADHLAAHPLPDYQPRKTEFPDEHILMMEPEEEQPRRLVMFFDGAMNQAGNGLGAVFVSPDGVRTPVTLRLRFECTNGGI